METQVEIEVLQRQGKSIRAIARATGLACNSVPAVLRGEHDGRYGPRVPRSTKLDDFKPTTVYTIYIAATPEQVWEALTSAEFSRKYFFGNAVEVNLKVGGTFIVRAPDGALHSAAKSLNASPHANSPSPSTSTGRR